MSAAKISSKVTFDGVEEEDDQIVVTTATETNVPSTKCGGVVQDIESQCTNMEMTQRTRFSSFFWDNHHRSSSLMVNIRRSSFVTAINRKKDWLKNAIYKVMGDDYSKREAAFVLFAGALISFNTGYVNGSCLSGLVSPNYTKVSVAGFTSKYTKSALQLGEGEWEEAGIQFGLIGSYFLGAFLSGLITPNGTPYRIEPTYGPTFLIGGIFLTAASILSANGIGDRYIFCFAAAAAGIQNGIASIFSANLIRCSLTGSTTDIAIALGQVLRGNRKKVWKSLVLLMIVSCFWLGGLISFYGTRHFRNYSLYFNAGLFFFIGTSLVLFLVKELHITVKEAVLGTWERTKGASQEWLEHTEQGSMQLDSIFSVGGSLDKSEGALGENSPVPSLHRKAARELQY